MMAERNGKLNLAFRPWGVISDYATAMDAAKCSRWAAGYVAFACAVGAAMSQRHPLTFGGDIVEAVICLLLLLWVWNPPQIAASTLILALVLAEVSMRLLAIFAPSGHLHFNVGWFWIHLFVLSAAILGLRGSVYMESNRSPEQMSLVF